MMSQIITVHNIHEAIQDVGIVPYANTLVQEMGGGYFFVDAEEITESEAKGPRPTTAWTTGSYETTMLDDNGLPYTGKIYVRYRVYPLPTKIAYFIIQALQIKSRVAQLGIPPASEIFEGSMAVYLTPGKEFMGQKIEKLTEIEAELRPVVVERL